MKRSRKGGTSAHGLGRGLLFARKQGPQMRYERPVARLWYWSTTQTANATESAALAASYQQSAPSTIRRSSRSRNRSRSASTWTQQLATTPQLPLPRSSDCFRSRPPLSCSAHPATFTRLPLPTPLPRALPRAAPCTASPSAHPRLSPTPQSPQHTASYEQSSPSTGRSRSASTERLALDGDHWRSLRRYRARSSDCDPSARLGPAPPAPPTFTQLPLSLPTPCPAASQPCPAHHAPRLAPRGGGGRRRR